MQLEKISFADTHAFNSFFLDYMQQKETLKPFYNQFPALENFKSQIDEKSNSFSSDARKSLVHVLQNQYQHTPIIDVVAQNIDALKDDKTFTVTTGHQLNIFTGPLYFIYKIITVINACKQLKARYPEYKFVPVYWMASEDHDYDEIKYFKLYGKKYTWNTTQAGAVGRFSLNDISSLLNEVPGDIKIFRDAYTKNKTLSDAVRHYVHTLFGEDGLVVIDADDAQLKSSFREVMHQDIFENINKGLVNKTNESLESLGYKTQIYCRDINFFYLDAGMRSRIEKSGDRFNVVDTTLSFSAAEMKKMIDDHPEKLSPNVILRPLYQEMILPNLAYVGGPAEVVYWLQLKEVFENFQVPLPMLMPRNFAMIIEHTVARTFKKTELELKDIFEDKNYIFNHWVLKHSPRNLSVGIERNKVNEIFSELRDRSTAVDKTLTAYVAAQGKRAMNSLEKIERKILRAEKRLHTEKLKQIESVKDALFPSGNLQERSDNFLNFYQQDAHFLQKISALLDPFDFKFNVLSYNGQP